MEEKLKAYRTKKAKEQEAENTWFVRLKRYCSRTSSNVDKKVSSPSHSADADQIPEDDLTLQTDDSNTQPIKRRKRGANSDFSPSEQQEKNVNVQVPSTTTKQSWLLLVLKSMLWLCVWGIFIEVGFGAVYFAVSLLIFIYFNTRTGQKDDKPSAYSVFNKDFEKIDGTVTAEQLQQNMFRLPGMSA